MLIGSKNNALWGDQHVTGLVLNRMHSWTLKLTHILSIHYTKGLYFQDSTSEFRLRVTDHTINALFHNCK